MVIMTLDVAVQFGAKLYAAAKIPGNRSNR